MTLGDFIKSYREEHKESLRSFSKRAGISPTYVSYLEKGETQRGKKPIASIETYRNIASAAGITLDSLIKIVDDEIALNEKNMMTEKEMRDTSPEKKALLNAVESMSKDELVRLLKIIEAMK